MPFNYPVTEIYSAEGKRCVFSAEEYELMLSEGWFDTQPVPEPDQSTTAVIDAPAPPPVKRKGRK